MKRTIIYNFCLSCCAATLAAFLFAVIAEATLRYLHKRRVEAYEQRLHKSQEMLPPADEWELFTHWISLSGYARQPDDPRQGFSLKPDIGGYMSYVRFRTNHEGFRDEEHSFRKPPQTIRWIFAGDSFTFGAGVKRYQRVSNILEDLLNEVPSLHFHYEIMNIGVTCYNTVAEEATLEQVLPCYEHDAVFLQWLDNDCKLMDSAREIPRGQSLFWRTLKIGFHQLTFRSPTRPPEANRVVFSQDTAWYETHALMAPKKMFEALRRIPSLTNRRVFLLVEGWSRQIMSGKPSALAREVCEKAPHMGFDVLEICDALADFKSVYHTSNHESLSVSTWDDHPSPRRNIATAGAILRFLIRKGFIPDSDSRRIKAFYHIGLSKRLTNFSD